MINLSIVILFCDKDVKYLSDILHQIDEKVKCSHEIILVDNRENDKSELPQGNYSVHSKGYNTYLFEGRRIGLDNAIGKYIWNIDADDELVDEITDDDFDLINDVDFVQCYYITDKLCPPKVGTFVDKPRAFGTNVWSRFYKRDFLKKLLQPIKRDLKLVMYEDKFIIDLVIENAEKMYHLQKCVYKYITARSCEMGGEFTKEKLNHLLVGCENLPYLYSFIKDETILPKLLYTQEKLRRKYE